MKNLTAIGFIASSVIAFGCSHAAKNSQFEENSKREIASSLQKYDCGPFSIYFEFRDSGRGKYIGPRGRECELLEVTNNPDYSYKNKERAGSGDPLGLRGYIPVERGGCAGPEGIRTIASIRIASNPRTERRVFIDQPDGGTSPYLCSPE